MILSALKQSFHWLSEYQGEEVRLPSDPLLKYEETIYIQHHDFPSDSILNGTDTQL